MVQAIKEIKIDLDNGLQISCLLRDGSGEALLFLHGFPDCKEVWSPVIAELPSSEPFLAIDIPSFGKSSLADDTQMSLVQLSASLMEVIKKAGFSSLKIVCHDWGGMLAWYLIASNPGMFTGMIITNSPHPYGYYTVLESSQEQKKIFNYVKIFCSTGAADLLSQNNLEFLKKNRSYHPDYGYFHSEEDFESAWNSQERLHAALGIYRQNVPMILLGQVPAVRTSIPLAIFWGKNDPALVPEQCEIIRKFADGPCSVDYVDGGHWAFLDDPKRFAALIMNQSKPSLAGS